MTQNQLIELIESEQVKALVERSEERGVIEPAELEAFALEHDLTDEEMEQLTRELETIGLEVGQRAPAKDKAEKEAEKEKEEAEPAPVAGRHRRRRQPAALPRRRRPAQAADRRRGGAAREADRARRPRSRSGA